MDVNNRVLAKHISRRSALGYGAGAVAGVMTAGRSAAPDKQGVLGIVGYSAGYRFGGFSEIASRRKEKRPVNPMGLIEYTAGLRLKCLQIPSNLLDLKDRTGLESLRARAENLGVELEMAGPNVEFSGMPDVMEAAHMLGMTSFRVILGMLIRARGIVKNTAEWNDFRTRSVYNLKRTAELAEKVHIPLLLENHTDVTTAEMLDILEQVGHERVGVALDFGNQLLVAEDPLESVKILAPYAGSTHLKDWVLNPAEDGCTVTMVALGTGMLDLPAMCAIVREVRPQTNIVIEMLVDQTLPIPFRKDEWWQGFPGRDDRVVATQMLEKMLDESSAPATHDYSAMSETDALAVEADALHTSIKYARQMLGIVN